MSMMSTAMGSSFFTYTPLHHSLSSPHSSLLNSLSTSGRKKRATAIECSKSPKDSSFCKRRALLFVGISVLPLIQLKGKSFQSLALEDTALKTLVQKQEEKVGLKENASPNSIFSLLNGVGILSAGVLGALYALERKENTVNEATIESMKSKLNKSEETIISLKKTYESKLLNESEELNKRIKTANEERQALISQLNLAKNTITGQGQELTNKQRLVEDLNSQIQNLQMQLAKASANRKELDEKLNEKLNSIEVLQGQVTLLSGEIKIKEGTIRDLESTVADKEFKFEKLNSVFEQTKDELVDVKSKKTGLRQELLETQEELSEKSAIVNDMSAQVSSLLAQRDELNKKLDILHNEFNDLKSSSEEKLVVHAKLLEERDFKIRQLEEKLNFTVNELSKNEELVADLNQERDGLKKLLDIEMKNGENLKHELKSTEDLLGKLRNEVCDLENELKKSRDTCSDLEGEISKIQMEYAKAKESFKLSLDEAKCNIEVLNNEMLSTREVLKNTKNEKKSISGELANALEKCKSLQNELVDVYKKAEKATNDLKQEKDIVSSLKKELQALEKQISKDKESRKSLETGLEDTTRSLDEMNRNALILSKELEDTNSHIFTLESEKELIYKGLDEQKRVTQEARENMEDAQNLLMRLGEEREGLRKREKRLEEELASAKGEILRLRSEMNTPKRVNNNEKSLKKVEPEKSTKKVVNNRKKVEAVEKLSDLSTVPVKKSRRKKSEPLPDSS